MLDSKKSSSEQPGSLYSHHQSIATQPNMFQGTCTDTQDLAFLISHTVMSIFLGEAFFVVVVNIIFQSVPSAAY